MTIEEAVEIDGAPYGSIPWQVKKRARSLIVAEYRRLTDPTPLTRELIEKELGPSDSGAEWIACGRILTFNSRLNSMCYGNLEIKTLSDLRQIVRMLRGGAA